MFDVVVLEGPDMLAEFGIYIYIKLRGSEDGQLLTLKKV